MTKKSELQLAALADIIRQVDQHSVIEIGRCLLEAKECCGHNHWGIWLRKEFNWSDKTAQRYMAVATLVAKFDKLSDLALARTTLYALTELDEAVVGDAVAALVEASTPNALTLEYPNATTDMSIPRRLTAKEANATLVGFRKAKITNAKPSGDAAGSRDLPADTLEADWNKATNEQRDAFIARHIEHLAEHPRVQAKVLTNFAQTKEPKVSGEEPVTDPAPTPSRPVDTPSMNTLWDRAVLAERRQFVETHLLALSRLVAEQERLMPKPDRATSGTNDDGLEIPDLLDRTKGGWKAKQDRHDTAPV